MVNHLWHSLKKKKSVSPLPIYFSYLTLIVVFLLIKNKLNTEIL